MSGLAPSQSQFAADEGSQLLPGDEGPTDSLSPLSPADEGSHFPDEGPTDSMSGLAAPSQSQLQTPSQSQLQTHGYEQPEQVSTRYEQPKTMLDHGEVMNVIELAKRTHTHTKSYHLFTESVLPLHLAPPTVASLISGVRKKQTVFYMV